MCVCVEKRLKRAHLIGDLIHSRTWFRCAMGQNEIAVLSIRLNSTDVTGSVVCLQSIVPMLSFQTDIVCRAYNVTWVNTSQPNSTPIEPDLFHPVLQLSLLSN